jgi:hypothetical protein
MKTRLLLLLLLLLIVCSCIIACERYDTNDVQILTTYSAKSTCTCIFVMKRDEDFCAKWVHEDPNVKTVSINYEKKQVESQAMALWGAKAHFVNQRQGCVVDQQ